MGGDQHHMSPASGPFAGSFVPMSRASARCGGEEESGSAPNICQSTVSIENAQHASERVRDEPGFARDTTARCYTGGTFKSRLQRAAHVKQRATSGQQSLALFFPLEAARTASRINWRSPATVGFRTVQDVGGRLCFVVFLYKSVHFLQLGLRWQPLTDCKKIIIIG